MCIPKYLKHHFALFQLKFAEVCILQLIPLKFPIELTEINLKYVDVRKAVSKMCN